MNPPCVAARGGSNNLQPGAAKDGAWRASTPGVPDGLAGRRRGRGGLRRVPDLVATGRDYVRKAASSLRARSLEDEGRIDGELKTGRGNERAVHDPHVHQARVVTP